MKIQIILLALALMLLQSCVVVREPYNESSHQVTTKSSNSSSQGKSYAINTISDAIAACKRIQQAQNIPVGCKTEYFDDKPAMFMVFNNSNDASQWIDALAEKIAVPYCNSANRSNRDAYVVSVIQQEQLGRIFRCESWEWDDWFTLEKENNKPSNISEVIQVCKNVQAAKEIPITCDASYYEGKPVMMIGYSDFDTGKQWIEATVEYIAEPYCNAANRGNRQAFVIFVINNMRIASIYSCETNEMYDWFDIGEKT